MIPANNLLHTIFILPKEIQSEIFIFCGIKTFVMLRECSKDLCEKVDAAAQVWRAFCMHLKLGYCLPNTKNWKQLLVLQKLQHRNMNLANPERLASRIIDLESVFIIQNKVYTLNPGTLTCIDDYTDPNPETINLPCDETRLQVFENDYFLTANEDSSSANNFVTLKTRDHLTVWQGKKPIAKSRCPGSYTIQDDTLIHLGQQSNWDIDSTDLIEIEFTNLKKFADKQKISILKESNFIGRVANTVITYVNRKGVIFYDLSNNGSMRTCPFPDEFKINSKFELKFQFSDELVMVRDTDWKFWYCVLNQTVFQCFGLHMSKVEPQLVKNDVYSFEIEAIQRRDLHNNSIVQTYPLQGLIHSMKIYGDRLVVLLETKLVIFNVDSPIALHTLDAHQLNGFIIHLGMAFCSTMNGYRFVNLATGEYVSSNAGGIGETSMGTITCYQRRTVYNYMRLKPLEKAPPEIKYDRVQPEPFQMPNSSVSDRVLRYMKQFISGTGNSAT